MARRKTGSLRKAGVDAKIVDRFGWPDRDAQRKVLGEDSADAEAGSVATESRAYLRQSEQLIRKALKEGCDVLQLGSGEIIGYRA